MDLLQDLLRALSGASAGVDAVQLLTLGVLGVAGGVLSGVVGVGGGIVFVPALVYVAGWGIKEAVAASLVIIIFASLTGTLRNRKSADPVDWRTAFILASAVAPASLIGVYVSRISTPTVVQFAFAGILLALAYPTARGRPNFDASKKIPVPIVLLCGVFIGALSGLVGVGGGVVMVPLMVLGLGLTTKRAVSTSLAVVMFTGIVASIGYIATGFDEILPLAPLVAGSMVGAVLGVRLRDRMPDRALKIGFAVFMVVTAFRTLGDATGIL
ncbi:MAG: sulfite exporter TauE/SafE family protein [Actinomycetota bacterium]|nr:sulfite exporter TauE/SafE family protein [Actinomycetota bacterium]